MDTPYGSALLPVWERPEPQPRAAPVPLSRAKIAATAVRLADAHGLDGLSVRKIAKEPRCRSDAALRLRDQQIRTA